MDREPPDFRATVLRDGTVRLVDWGPWLTTGGPLYTLLDARGRAGIGIADLTVIRDDDNIAVEVIFDFCCGDTPGHRTTLRDWAARVGYRRAWFAGRSSTWRSPRAAGRRRAAPVVARGLSREARRSGTSSATAARSRPRACCAAQTCRSGRRRVRRAARRATRTQQRS